MKTLRKTHCSKLEKALDEKMQRLESLKDDNSKYFYRVTMINIFVKYVLKCFNEEYEFILIYDNAQSYQRI